MSPQPSPGHEPLTAALDDVGVQARLDHVAVAAARLRDLLPLYRDLLGGRYLGGGDNPRVGYRACQFGFLEGKIELMEPLAGSSFLDSFLDRGGGMHHVTFKVDDIEAAIAAARALGYAPTGIYLDDPSWREAFLHPREADGVLVQVAQAAPGYPPSDPGDQTLEDLLAGNGWNGNGEPSP